VWRSGTLYLDINGNGTWDASDRTMPAVGLPGDIPLVNGTTMYLFRSGGWLKSGI
jgi:hypothetical protein